MRRLSISVVWICGLLVGCSSDGGSSSESLLDPASTSPTATAQPTTNAPTTIAPTTIAPTTIAPVSTELLEPTLAGDAAFLGPLQTVPVGELTMAFRQFGAGPDLVMIAGEGSPMDSWPVTMLAALADSYRVTIYDNRDLGSTTDTTTPFTLPDLADDVAGLIESLALDRPAVFGWSTGGEIGLLLAVQHPDVLSALVVSGATAGGPLIVGPEASIAACLNDEALPCDLLSMLFSATPEGDAAKTTFAVDYGKVPHPTSAPDAMRKYIDAEKAFGTAPAPPLSSIAVPTMVMNGDLDPLVPVANAPIIADQIGPGTRLETDPSGSHAWFFEHLDRFLELMADFLGTA